MYNLILGWQSSHITYFRKCPKRQLSNSHQQQVNTTVSKESTSCQEEFLSDRFGILFFCFSRVNFFTSFLVFRCHWKCHGKRSQVSFEIREYNFREYIIKFYLIIARIILFQYDYIILNQLSIYVIVQSWLIIHS